MSSLKQQLKKIGTLDLRNVSEASRKTKASFLFSAREAADQDLETIYSIAYNGIMELVILDEKFSAFEKTLFSEGMKSVDRVLQVSGMMLANMWADKLTQWLDQRGERETRR